MENGQIKIIRQYHIKSPIDGLIRRWADANVFLEGNPANLRLMDENNHAYCFHKKIENGIVCVLIDTLDRQVRVEAWIMDEIRYGSHTADTVCRLFEMLDSTYKTDLINKRI